MNGTIFAVLLCITFSLPSIAQEILRAPEDTVVFLGQSSMFTCESDGGLSGWRVNGTLRRHLPPEIHNDLSVTLTTTAEGTTVEELTIPARAEYNGTTVQCLAVAVGDSAESENATLKIQGPLSAVGDLRASNDASSVTIWWTAPFSLDVTGVDPDIWYSVLIYSVTDEDNPTAILCTDCTNITETHYTFTPDYLSPCHVYNFSVTPFNGAGQGESSPNTTGYTLNDNKPPAVTFAKPEIRALTRDTCSVSFNVTGELESVCFFLVKGFKIFHSGGTLTFELAADKWYSFQLSAHNAAGDMEAENIAFSTYDVQSLLIKNGSNGEIDVLGLFLTGSSATGVLIVLQGNITTADIFQILLNNQSETDVVSGRIKVPPSVYAVYGFDLEHNFYPNPMAAVVLKSEISITRDYMSSSSEGSKILRTGNISLSGSSVVIDCEFAETSPQASCVLVYREYGSPLLTVAEFPQFIYFPVAIIVEDPEHYTFALFGKDGTIETKPAIVVRPTAVKGDVKVETEKEKEKTNNSQVKVIAIAISSGVVFAIACGSAVSFLIVRQYHNRRKLRKAMPPQARNVEYDEVVLPPTTSSSAIPTEPNTAYATTTMSPIPTSHNVAHSSNT